MGEPSASEGRGTRRRRALVAWVLVAGFTGFVLYLGGATFEAGETSGLLAPLLQLLFPDLSANERYLLHLKIRKVAHVVEYGVLALLALRAAFLTFRSATSRIAAIALGLAVAVAATDETRQSFLPERTGSIRDVMIDASGAITALGLALWIRRLSRRGPPGDRAP